MAGRLKNSLHMTDRHTRHDLYSGQGRGIVLALAFILSGCATQAKLASENKADIKAQAGAVNTIEKKIQKIEGLVNVVVEQQGTPFWLKMAALFAAYAFIKGGYRKAREKAGRYRITPIARRMD